MPSFNNISDLFNTTFENIKKEDIEEMRSSLKNPEDIKEMVTSLCNGSMGNILSGIPST